MNLTDFAKRTALKAELIRLMNAGKIFITVNCGEIEPTFTKIDTLSIVQVMKEFADLSTAVEDSLKELANDNEVIGSVRAWYASDASPEVTQTTITHNLRKLINAKLWEEAISDTFTTAELQDIYKQHPEFEELSRIDNEENPSDPEEERWNHA